MPTLIRRLRSGEQGFTMIVAMGTLFVLLSLSAAGFAAVRGDLNLTQRNGDTKVAYAAAEAGVSDYASHLNADPSYWTKCDTPAGITQPRAAGVDSTEWQNLNGTGSAQYTIEVLPATGPTCDSANPTGTMLASDGTFKVRVTGRASSTSKARRSIVATFKRTGFLDYLYWTDKETVDPLVLSKLWSCDTTATCYTTGGPGGEDSLQTWATQQCSQYWRNGRGNATYPNQIFVSGAWQSHATWMNTVHGVSGGLKCSEISFITGDDVNGPLHTNDSLYICGTPAFGRASSDDPIEVEAGENLIPDQQPWRPNPAGACGTSIPNWRGRWLPGSRHMDPPSSNAGLASTAWQTYTGGTKIVFGAPSANQMQITNNGTTQTFTQPSNAVIYVNNGTCATNYDPINPVVTTGAAGQGCGDIAVSGTYNQNITLAASNDIVITDDLQMAAGSDKLLGLIANNFVRIAHPSSLGTTGQSRATPWPNCANVGTTVNDIYVDAAIFALNHSFVVDRYGCGNSLGLLHLKGAIAQAYRGAVGPQVPTGFTKAYVYDDRLRFRSPPNFVDPVNSAWRVARQLEQRPAN